MVNYYVLEGRDKEKVVGSHFWSYQGKPREINSSIIEVQTGSDVCTSLLYSE
jgi:hypothetical protein